MKQKIILLSAYFMLSLPICAMHSKRSNLYVKTSTWLDSPHSSYENLSTLESTTPDKHKPIVMIICKKQAYLSKRFDYDITTEKSSTPSFFVALDQNTPEKNK